MILHLHLNEDHLKLIKFIKIINEDDNFLKIDKVGMLMIQSHVLDDVAMILGMKDKVIKGTSGDADGGAYPDEIEKYLLETYNYVRDNLYYIETLLHQFATEGIKVGHYKCNDANLFWEKVDNEE